MQIRFIALLALAYAALGLAAPVAIPAADAGIQ